jgi:hypothetical protein
MATHDVKSQPIKGAQQQIAECFAEVYVHLVGLAQQEESYSAHYHSALRLAHAIKLLGLEKKVNQELPSQCPLIV